MQTPVYSKTLILVGGGHSHAIAIKRFAMYRPAGLRIILISKVVDTPYSGMIPGYIAGHYSHDECHIDLRLLCEACDISFIHAEVENIDAERKTIFCKHRKMGLYYDYLSIDIGSTPNLTSISAYTHLVTAVKPIELFLPLLQRIQAYETVSLMIVGGGIAAIELAMAFAYRLQQSNKCANIYLLIRSRRILRKHKKLLVEKVIRQLNKSNIKIISQSQIQRIEQNESKKKVFWQQQQSSQTLEVDEIIWATHASAAKWLQSSGISLNESGFIRVNQYLQSISHPDVFAAGDIIDIEGFKLEKSGVYAVREGEPLYQNLIRSLRSLELKKYTPQENFLCLINCADHYAIATKHWFLAEGKWLWQLKCWIDQRFMRGLLELPEKKMMTSPQTEIKLDYRCAGCGGKIPAHILSDMLTKIADDPVQQRLRMQRNIVLSVKDADDAAAFEDIKGQLWWQSVDFFKAFLSDTYLVGKIMVLHALSDLYAKGATAHSAQLLISLPNHSPKIQQDMLGQMMQGVVDALNQQEVVLLGGHTSEGEQLSCGLVANGTSNTYLTKTNDHRSQSLILTKPIGSGMLLAANMRAKAKGRWIELAIKQMSQSNRKASELIYRAAASCVSDVTGFGLLGHLHSMLKKYNCGIEVMLENIPLMEGVEYCLEQSIMSSLYEANTLIGHQFEFQNDNPIAAILFDPQTNGGLLALVDDNKAENLIEELRVAGYRQSAIIGHTLNDKRLIVK